MQEKMALENKTDFVKENKRNVIDDFNMTTKERMMMSKEMRDSYLERAKIKRQQQDEQDHKMKYFKLFRWALI